MSRGRDRRAGFLLVEALVTLALSALLLVGLASVLGLLLRSGDRTADRAEAQEVSSRLFAALERDIAAAAPIRFAGRDARFVFGGGADRLVFAIAGEDAVRAVALEAEPQAGGTRLLRAEAEIPPGATGLPDLAFADAAEVYSGPEVIAFRYAGRSGPGQAEFVADAWPSGQRHPDAVLVETRSAGARIAFAITAEPACADPEAPCTLRLPREEDEDAGDGEDDADAP